MQTSISITHEDFKTIHNGLCDLKQVCDRLDGVLSNDIYQLLIRASNEIRRGMENAYYQEEQDFVKKSRHYTEVQKELDTTHSEWSIYDVDNMADRHPFEGADRVVYRSHWGPKPVSVSVNGLSWSALWMAANACIRDSGDEHHVFIEQFSQDPQDSRTLILSTGS